MTACILERSDGCEVAQRKQHYFQTEKKHYKWVESYHIINTNSSDPLPPAKIRGNSGPCLLEIQIVAVRFQSSWILCLVCLQDSGSYLKSMVIIKTISLKMIQNVSMLTFSWQIMCLGYQSMKPVHSMNACIVDDKPCVFKKKVAKFWVWGTCPICPLECTALSDPTMLSFWALAQNLWYQPKQWSHWPTWEDNITQISLRLYSFTG